MNLDWLDGFCLRLFLTLLHFVWQAALLGAVAGWLNQRMRSRTASQRYNVNLVLFACLPICVLATFSTIQIPIDVRAATNAGGQFAIRATAVPEWIAGPANETGNSDGPIVEQTTQPVTRSTFTAESSTSNSVGSFFGLFPSNAQSRIYVLTLLYQNAPWVTAVYLFSSGFFLLRLSILMRLGRRLRASSRPIIEAHLIEAVKVQARKLKLRYVPEIAYCAHVAVPTVIGILRPIILVPMTCLVGVNPSQFDMILAHELAHLQRHDLLVNMLQQCIQAVLFFHPAVWYISRRLSDARELCCDDLVIAMGYNRMHYAETLLRLAETSIADSERLSMALASSGHSPSQFEVRLQRLMGANLWLKARPKRSTPLFVAALAVICAAATILSHHSAIAFQAPGNPDRKEPARDEIEEEVVSRTIDQPEAGERPLKEDISSTQIPFWIRKLDEPPRQFDWHTAMGPIVIDDQRMLIGDSIISIPLGARISILPFANEKFKPFFMRLSANRKRLLVCGHEPFEPMANTMNRTSLLQVWDVDAIKQIGETIAVQVWPMTSDSKFDISHDGSIIAAGDRDEIAMWDLATGACLAKFPIPATSLLDAVSLSPDGNMLVVSRRNDLHFWDWRNGTEPQTIHAGRHIISLAFSPDSRYLAEGPDYRATIEIRDLRTMNVAFSLHDEFNSPLLVRSLTFSTDGKHLILGNAVMTDETKLTIPHRILVWEIESGKRLHQIATPNHLPMTIAVTPDGKYLSAMMLRRAAKFSAVAVWDLKELDQSNAAAKNN